MWHKRGVKERNAHRVEWVETNVKGNVWDKDSSKTESEGLQESSEVCYNVRLGDGGADTNTGDRAEDAKILLLEGERIERLEISRSAGQLRLDLDIKFQRQGWDDLAMCRGYFGKVMLNKELQGRKERGRPHSKFMDVVKRDMLGLRDRGGC